MTIDELLRALTGAFPAFNAAALESWAPIFRVRLAKHEGPVLRQAYTETLARFTVAKSKSLFPVPADFEAHLPSGHPKMAAGPVLDFKARNHRARELMAEWQEAQGNRAAGGNHDVMRALLHMAEPIANLAAWSKNPEPIRLTRAQVRVVQQRAISQERVKRFGPITHNTDGKGWWDQIEIIAQEWGIAVAYGEWGQTKQQEGIAA